MILMVEPIANALKDLRTKEQKNTRVILLDPGGKRFDQAKAREFAKLDHLIFVAAHYETVDHRVREHLIDEEVSIGDYVLTGGELPAMVIVDAITRLLPGVLKKEDATVYESFESGVLEYPQYTRPENYKGWKVPEILLSGDHNEIEKWKKEHSLLRTRKNRPDLLARTSRM